MIFKNQLFIFNKFLSKIASHSLVVNEIYCKQPFFIVVFAKFYQNRAL